MDEFDGLVAVVTGGAGGIGAAVVSLLARRGASVAVFDRADALPVVVTDPDAPDGPSMVVRCDVTDTAAVQAGIAAVVDRFGRLDIVVNNAGIGAQGTVEANPDEQWHHVLDVNVVGMVRVARAALPHLRRSPHAAVVNVCSAVAHVGVRDRALYGASKGAVAALTLAMAADHAGEGVRVNAVSPGTADTPWVARLLADADDPQAARTALRARQPLGRLVTADEVAHAVVALASPAAASTTGAVLRVDGGMASLRV